MRKIYVFTILALLTANLGMAQSKINNNWFTGNIGFDFNVTPTELYGDNDLYHVHGGLIGGQVLYYAQNDLGKIVLSDSNGVVVLSSNGNVVLDANQNPMPNGITYLGYTDPGMPVGAGDGGTSVVLVPNPVNENLYYLFYGEALMRTSSSRFLAGELFCWCVSLPVFPV
jgi:hypothetical protein